MKISLNTFLAIALSVLVLAYLVGCMSTAAPPRELADDLKLSDKQRKGMSADELARATADFMHKADTDLAAEKAKVQKLIDAEPAEQEKIKAKVTATIADLQADAQTKVDELTVQYQLDVGRIGHDSAKLVRVAQADGQLQLVNLGSKSRAAADGFDTFAREQDQKRQRVASGIASAQESIESQDYLKKTLVSVGMQAAVPYVPAGILTLAGTLVGNIFGQKKGDGSIRALNTAITATGNTAAVDAHLAANAEPDEVARIMKFRSADGQMPTAASAVKLATAA